MSSKNSRRDDKNVTPIMKVEIFISNLEKFAVIVKKRTRKNLERKK